MCEQHMLFLSGSGAGKHLLAANLFSTAAKVRGRSSRVGASSATNAPSVSLCRARTRSARRGVSASAASTRRTRTQQPHVCPPNPRLRIPNPRPQTPHPHSTQNFREYPVREEALRSVSAASTGRTRTPPKHVCPRTTVAAVENQVVASRCFPAPKPARISQPRAASNSCAVQLTAELQGAQGVS